MNRRRLQKGANLVEFSLVGIPLIMVMISLVEVARGMWMYNTIAHSLKEAMRLTIVKGENCRATPNNCKVSVGRIMQEVRDSGLGLPADDLNVTMQTITYDPNTNTYTVLDTVTCAPIQSCAGNSTLWPTSPNDAVGDILRMRATIPFRSALLFLWPGAGSAYTFPTYILTASAQERIQF